MLRVLHGRYITVLETSTRSGSKGNSRRGLSSVAGLNTRLVEVGVLENPSDYSIYKPGQLFLHKVFGYRGVILFHWVCRLYNRDNQGNQSSLNEWEEEGILREKINELKYDKRSFYQILIDQRDFHQVRSPPEGITLINTEDDKSLYSISGLDYVGHDNILPYTCTSTRKGLSIHHDLYSQFFSSDDQNTVLSSWQKKNINWLKQVDVHCETTKDISITVMPFYMGCREIQKSYLHWWRYCICIVNKSSTKVQLRQRHWRIFSSSGTLETVRGEGVIGQQPVLTRNQPAFQYSSHVSLQASSGHMWGTFRFETEDGGVFDARIPPFNLKTPENVE